jgi:predicted GIY-YIG superfamily endonuclease
MDIEHDRRMSAYPYILRCADRSYYVGATRGSLETRLSQREAGAFDGYTARRRPLALVFHQEFERIEDAVAAVRQVKGWRREKKEALIRGDLAALPTLSRRAARPPVRASTARFARAQHECDVDGILRPPSS